MKQLKTLLAGALLCALLVGCAQNQAPPAEDIQLDSTADVLASDDPMIDETGTVAYDSPKDAYNLLTGEYNLAQDRVGMRPFAFDVNNIYDCWPNAGLSQADVLFEYDAAGGIPRITALYSDIRDVPRIGSIRSLRMSGINCVYQMNPVFVCMGTIVGTDDFFKQTGYRILDANAQPDVIYNDLTRVQTYAIEHCWYTSGRLVYNTLDNDAALIKSEHNGDPLQPIFDFNPTQNPATPTGGRAATVNVKFSQYVQLRYDYDAETTRWMRSEYGEPHIDANTGEQLGFENVLILFCTNKPYENTYIMNIQYELGGTGYWFSRGAVQTIHWDKDGSDGRFVLTTEQGEPLLLNAGNTCVSLIDKEYSNTLVFA